MVSGWQQALTLIVVLIPGFVYQGVKRRRVGPSPEDSETSIRLLRSVVTSVVFLVLYAIVLGDFIVARFVEVNAEERLEDIWLVGMFVGGLVFGIPALAGHFSGAYRTRERFFSRPDVTTFWSTVRTKANPDNGELTWTKALFHSDTDYSPIPTAWDYATENISAGSFVRVLLSDDTWLGGQADEGSYFTSYPEPRDLYIDRAWQLNEDGSFECELPGPTGVWIPCVDAKLLQVVPPADDEPDSSEEKAHWTDWMAAAGIVTSLLLRSSLRSWIIAGRRQR